MANIHIAARLDDGTEAYATFLVDNPGAQNFIEAIQKAPGLMGHETTARLATAFTQLAEAKHITDEQTQQIMRPSTEGEDAGETTPDTGNASGSAASLDGSGPAGGPTPPANPDDFDSGSQPSSIPDMDSGTASTPENPPNQVAETKTLEVNTPAMAPVTE